MRGSVTFREVAEVPSRAGRAPAVGMRGPAEIGAAPAVSEEDTSAGPRRRFKQPFSRGHSVLDDLRRSSVAFVEYSNRRDRV